MNRIRIINGVFVLLFVALATFTSFAQQTKEPFQLVWERASLAMRQKDYDAQRPRHLGAGTHQSFEIKRISPKAVI